MKKLESKFIVFLTLIALCSSCSPRILKHGYVSNESHIKIGDEKDTVIKKLGDPSIRSKDGNVFYYISYEIKTTNPLGIKVVSSDSIELVFENNRLKERNVVKVTNEPLISDRDGVSLSGIHDSLLRNVSNRFRHKH